MNTTLYDIISNTETQQSIRESLLLGKQLTDSQIEYIAALLNFATDLDSCTEDNYVLNVFLNNTEADSRLRLPQRLKYAATDSTTEKNPL